MSQFIGFVAAALTTIAFLPQVIKTYKSRSAEGLSLSTFTLLTSGVLLWLIYGLMVMDLPVIFANFLTLILAISLLFMKFKYRAQ